ncbi:MAG: hypothetical protein RL676_438 [Pseudomonadota bacterium]|jgi:hypothetical protein
MKKIIFFLSLAVIAGAASMTPLAAHWNVFSLGTQASDGHALGWVIEAWRAVVDGLANGQVLSAATASEWRSHGVGIDQALAAVAVVCVVLGWIAALGGRASSKSTAPVNTPDWREVAVGLSQAQHGLTNVLLDPRSQPVAEPLADIARQLDQISETLSSAEHGSMPSNERVQ